MKKTKPYWHHNTAYSMEPYFVYLDFPNLIYIYIWILLYRSSIIKTYCVETWSSFLANLPQQIHTGKILLFRYNMDAGGDLASPPWVQL